MLPKEKAEWNRRVNEAAFSLDLSCLTGWTQEQRDALAGYMAAEILWTLDMLKEPGILHQVLKRKN